MPDFKLPLVVFATVSMLATLVMVFMLLQLALAEPPPDYSRLDAIQAQLLQLQELVAKLPVNPHRPSFLFGLPTVSREGVPSPYLKETLSTLLLPHDFPFDFKILVFLAELRADHRDALRRDLLRSFPQQVLSNKLMIIEIPDPAGWYPPALYTAGRERCQLKRNFGDSMLRVVWRSKLVMDFAFILAQAAAICEENHLTHYIHLEDDVRLDNFDRFVNFTKTLQKHPITTQDMPWFLISLANNATHFTDAHLHIFHLKTFFAGLFGLVLNPRYLKDMSDYFVAHFDEMPADWLISEYYTRKLHRQPVTLAACNVFEHAGTTSSKSDVDTLPSNCYLKPSPSEELQYVCWPQCDGTPTTTKAGNVKSLSPVRTQRHSKGTSKRVSR